MPSVLVVDDDPDLRSILAFMLEDAGHVVSEAGDGHAAIAALADGPACVVLDVMMPGTDGFGVLAERRARGLASGSRFVILTCKTAERDYVRGWELGADRYLTKPFDPDQLVATVDELLATPLEELARQRDEELNKARLLDRLDAMFK
jgi:DNA-binding response OmpR family regulator